jgi:hypothetical protein
MGGVGLGKQQERQKWAGDGGWGMILCCAVL